MKTEHLHDVWAGPDNTRLTSKQFSFRFPVHIAAKIAALCEMYPTKNRTHIVADLLAAALDHLEQGLPKAPGEPVEPNYNDEIARQIGQPEEVLYYLGGVRGQFRQLANRHFKELEAELGNENPTLLYESYVGSKDDFTGK
jgi:hypothetical protein